VVEEDLVEESSTENQNSSFSRAKTQDLVSTEEMILSSSSSDSFHSSLSVLQFQIEIVQQRNPLVVDALKADDAQAEAHQPANVDDRRTSRFNLQMAAVHHPANMCQHPAIVNASAKKQTGDVLAIDQDTESAAGEVPVSGGGDSDKAEGTPLRKQFRTAADIVRYRPKRL
jgi:hypothetical protein